MNLEGWQRYLQPGRMLERGGVKFPLRADEVKYGPIGRLLSDPPSQLRAQGSISPEDMANLLEQNLPDYGPKFKTLLPRSEVAPPSSVSDIRNPARGYPMHYEDQYQLPGEKLGQSEELTLQPGSDFVPSTAHFGGQKGLLSWHRATRRPISGASEMTSIEEPRFTVIDRNGNSRGVFGSEEEAQDYINNPPSEMTWVVRPESAKIKPLESNVRRELKSGDTAYHIEEIQSDWHQRGREEGYSDPDKARLDYRSSLATEDHGGATWVTRDGQHIGTLGQNDTLDTWWERNAGRYVDNTAGIPRAPYEKTYGELELRKALANAVHNGDSYVTWTTGDQQADRWGQALRNSVDELHWTKKPDGTFDLVPYKGGQVAGVDERLQNLTSDQLHDMVGADIAKRITEGEGKTGLTAGQLLERDRLKSLQDRVRGSDNLAEINQRLQELDSLHKQDSNHGVVAGSNLTVGGSGMRLFYDRKVPEAARKLAAQYGGEVTKVKIPGGASPLDDSTKQFIRSFSDWLPQFGDGGDIENYHNFEHFVAGINDSIPGLEGSMEHDNLLNTMDDHASRGSDATLREFEHARNDYINKAKELSKPIDTSQEVHALKITPEMRRRVLEAGLPLFSAGALAGMGTGLYGETGEPVQGQPDQSYAEGGMVTGEFPHQYDDVDMQLAHMLAKRHAVREFSDKVFDQMYPGQRLQQEIQASQDAADAERMTHWTSQGQGRTTDWTDQLNEPDRTVAKLSRALTVPPLEFGLGVRQRGPGEDFAAYNQEQSLNAALNVGGGAALAGAGRLGKGALSMVLRRPWTAVALGATGLVGGATADKGKTRKTLEDLVAGYASGGAIKKLGKIVAAAIKGGDGQLYLGPSHGDAFNNMSNALPEHLWTEGHENIGYLDEYGKYLTQKEAFKRARKLGQIGTRRGQGFDQFISEDIQDLMDYYDQFDDNTVLPFKKAGGGFVNEYALGGAVDPLSRIPAYARPFHQGLDILADVAPETALPSQGPAPGTSIAGPGDPRTATPSDAGRGGSSAPVLPPYLLPVPPPHPDDPVSQSNQGGNFAPKPGGRNVDYLSPDARALILTSEGMNQPSAWPGGHSGITIGRGYDLGQHTQAEFQRDWGPYLPADQMATLSKAVGKSGLDAAAVAPFFKNLHVSETTADKVFDDVLAPQYIAQTRAAFPGFDQLPSDAQGALVSLVFNRGPALDGARRAEMANIHAILADGVQDGDLEKIAEQLRSMKRLWADQGQGGLMKRRDREAELVLSSQKAA